MRRSRRPDPWRGLPAPPGLLRLLCLGLLLGGPQAATAQPLFDGSAADVWVLGADGQPVGHGTGRPSHTTAAIRAHGFPTYARGHFGHGLGTGPGSEEWPFIAADSTEVITPGMVLAFECPWYITGLGGFIIEDQVEITSDGPVSMNTLSRDLISVG